MDDYFGAIDWGSYGGGLTGSTALTGGGGSSWDWAGSLTGNYLSRLADIELQHYAIKRGVVPNLPTTQAPISVDRSQGNTVLGLDLGALLPLVLVGVIVYAIARA